MTIKEKLKLKGERAIVAADACGDHWQENIFSRIKMDINQDWDAFIEELYKRATDVAYDYFDPEEEGIYADEYEDAEEYWAAVDRAFSDYCCVDINLSINGRDYEQGYDF